MLWRSKIALISGILLILTSNQSYAGVIDDLQSQIAERNQRIAEIEAEIAKYEREITQTQGQAQTLSVKIRELDATRRKLEAEIRATGEKIGNANLSIQELELELEKTKKNIEERLTALADSLRQIERELSNSFFEIVLSNQSISQTLERVEETERLQSAVQDNLGQLKSFKAILENKRLALLEARENLNRLQREFTDKKTIAEINQRSTSNLLAETKNREASFKKILSEQVALREQFERELLDFESRLRLAIDPSNLPAAKAGVLAFPVKNVYITQYFGLTQFALANPGVYNGRGHNGVDFRASVGTEILAAENGEVLGAGNTDLGCPGGSYGRWILIKHSNGLATSYGHLSLIKVNQGQKVSRGELIGYSGSSGYAIGPHLHFTVYAAQTVRIAEITRTDGTKSKCGPMPLSPLNGYLNPLDYL